MTDGELVRESGGLAAVEGKMADDRLKNFVLSLADHDDKLSDQAKLVVLAALEGSDDLVEVLVS
ncbi:hypothetical protein M2272_005765 [Mycobacterium frederiksbergense]|uniref:ANTAR domain-containing protein n=1 Tax=Mycolicibacterium frederiksbergense TaxID=117567 RepID=A0ABT6L892_9MYCO|nr:hypothetical protein [Mycolicibacterium frederiksbergense]MDH6199098.1 hypothetical protein [Mycolicibacterium frederiksbergense]